MEVLTQERYHVLGIHTLQESDFALCIFMRNLLFVARQEHVGQWNLASVEDCIAFLLCTIRTLALVEFDRVDEGVNFSNLCLSSLYLAERSIFGHVADEETDAERVAVESIPGEYSRKYLERKEGDHRRLTSHRRRWRHSHIA